MRMPWLVPAVAAATVLLVAWTALSATHDDGTNPDLSQLEHHVAVLPVLPKPAQVHTEPAPPSPNLPAAVASAPEAAPPDNSSPEPVSEPATVRVSFRPPDGGMAVCGDAIAGELRLVGAVSAVAESETTRVVSLLVVLTDPALAFLDSPLIVQTGSDNQVRAARILKRYYTDEDPAKPIEEVGCTADSTGEEPPIRKGNVVFAEIGPWHGSYAAWFPDGSRACEGEFRHGMRIGQWNFWYPGGTMCCRGEFSMGRQSGTWNYWHPDGSVRAETRHSSWQLGLRTHYTDFVVEARDANGDLLPAFQMDHYLSRAVSARRAGLAVTPIIDEAEHWFDALEGGASRLDLEPVLANFRTVAEQTKELPDTEAADALSNARDRIIHWRNSCFPPVPGMNWGSSMPVLAEPSTLDELDVRPRVPPPRSSDPQEP